MTVTRRGVLVLAVGIVGCATPETRPQIGLPKPATKDGLAVTVAGLLYRGSRVSGIAGVAKNTTARDFKLVSLYFDLLFGDGLKVAEAVANTSGLAAGQSWAFEALVISTGNRPFDYIGAPRVTVL